jgi:hypothetical protein
VLQRHIALVLFPSNRYRAIKDALEAARLRLVSAASLTGVYDVLLRFYEPDDATAHFPKAPYRTFPDEELNRIAQVNRMMKVTVAPDQIYKYRTVTIERLNSDWKRRKEEIERLLPRSFDNDERHELLSAACRLARNWNDNSVSEDLRQRVAPFFLEEREIVPRLGPGSGNTLRQRFVLVALTSRNVDWDVFETQIIRNWLVSVPVVRSVYHLSTRKAFPEFHVWIDIIADPYDTDAIISQLETRCEDLSIEIGVRSMDVMEQLVKESVEGIYNADFGEKAKAFLGALHQQLLEDLDPDLTTNFHNVVLACADAWMEQTDKLSGAKDHEGLREKVTEFYGCFFSGNFSKVPECRERHLRHAAAAWLILYQLLEHDCTLLLLKALRVEARAKLDAALAAYFSDRGKAESLGELKGNTVRALLEYMKTEDRRFDGFEMQDLRREAFGPLRRFRNNMVHENQCIERLSISQKPSKQQVLEVNTIASFTRMMLDLLLAVRHRVAAGGFPPGAAA